MDSGPGACAYSSSGAAILAWNLIVGYQGSKVNLATGDPRSMTQGDKKTPREKQIPLNDLIAKRDVKAGFRTVFGASQAKPQKQPQKKPRI
jgi:hypothetical protein